MKGIDLNDVAAFVRVAEGGGFTAAAKVLGVPKSTVSRALVSPRACARRPPRAAHDARPRAHRRGTRLLRARARCGRRRRRGDGGRGRHGTDPRGTIRVTAPVDLGQVLLAEVAAGFIEQYPQVRFEVSLTSRVVDLVAEGFDLAVRASPLTDSSLVARKLGSADLGIFASPAYLKQHGHARESSAISPSTTSSASVRFHGSPSLSGPEGEERPSRSTATSRPTICSSSSGW